jgi:hypothetical protein
MIRFVFTAKPTSNSTLSNDLAGANVVVWVNDKDQALAEAKARSYIMDFSWIVQKLEFVTLWPDEMCPDPNKEPREFALYQTAEKRGISMEFYAWPKDPDSGLHEYRVLGAPLTSHGIH